MTFLYRLKILWSRIRVRYLGRDDIVAIDMGAAGYRIGRVRAWGRHGRRYYRGDPAPHMNNLSTYSVETVEGWFVTVAKGKVASWSVKPICSPVVKVNGKVLLAGWGR